MASSIDWKKFKDELTVFNPSLSTISNDTPSMKKAIHRTLQVFLMRKIDDNNNAINEAFKEFKQEAKTLISPQQYNKLIKKTPLFTNAKHRANDITTATINYILKEYGYLALKTSDDLNEFIRDNAPDALEAYHVPQIETEADRLRRQISEIEDNELTDDTAQQLQQRIQNQQAELERIIQLNQQINQYKRDGRSINQAFHYLRIRDEELRNKLRNPRQTIDNINEQLQRNITQLQRHQATETRLNNLRARLAELEEVADEVYEIPATEALAETLRREAQQLETERIEQRQREFLEFLDKRAHNEAERSEIIREQNNVVNSKDSIRHYFDDYPIDNERIAQTIEDLQPNNRVYLNNFSNEERELLKPHLLEKLKQLFQSIEATDTVQILFGRDGVEPRYAPTIKTKADAFDFLNNWITNTLIIRYNEETHHKLTDGDRESVAELWTVDYFEIKVKRGDSALTLGYSKYYFPITNQPIKINGVEYSEEFIIEKLKRYQIYTEPQPPKNCVPCFIHCLLSLDWSEKERVKVSDLLYSRIKYLHISGADCAALLEELNISAVIYDRDNGETVSFSAHGIKNSSIYQSQEGLLFGTKQIKGKANKQYFTKKLYIDVFKKHAMIHDDNALNGLNSWELITELINQQRLKPLNYLQALDWNEQLPEHPPAALYSYSSTVWKSAAQVLQYNGHKYNRPNAEKLALKKLTIESPELKTREFKESEASLTGWSLLLNYMIDNNLNILADSGTVAQFFRQSIRGALVNSLYTNFKPSFSISSLDINSFYWFCLSQIDAPLGLPRSIPPQFTKEQILNLVNSGAIVFLRCDYNYLKTSPIDREPKNKLVLTSWDIKSGNFEILESPQVPGTASQFEGFYWESSKVSHQPFKPFINKMYELKQHNKSLKRVINAGIGRLIKKYKPAYYRASATSKNNVLYLGDMPNGKEKWINSVDWSYSFHTLHALILSYASYYLHAHLFKICEEREVPIFYTSTDSLTVPTSKLDVLADLIGPECGKLKVEAEGENAIFIRRGLYYINDTKYSSQNVPHAELETFAKNNRLTIREVFAKLLNGPITFKTAEGVRYTIN